MTLFAAIVLAAACTVYVTRAGIFEPLRALANGKWQAFIRCPLCAGWWVALPFAISVAVRHRPSWPSWGSLLEIVGGAAASGCLALLFVIVWERLME